MSDRELLELAAKAAGIRLKFEDIYPLRFIGLNPDAGNVENWSDWNPLTDDGDALRLAVKLGLQIECRFGERDFVAVRLPMPNWKEYRESTLTEHVPVATRRCIVRAAAELAKSMPATKEDGKE